VRRAHTLLLADEQQPVQSIAAMLHTSAVTVTQTCKRFLTAGLEAALYDRPRPGSHRKLDGRQEAHLVALACRRPPAGRDRWSLRLLAARVVELGLVDALSSATVRRVLKKNRAQAVVKGAGVPPRGERRVRRPEGRPARSVRGT
jgi:transposase